MFRRSRAATPAPRQVLRLAISLAIVAALLLGISFAVDGSSNPQVLAVSRGLRGTGWLALLGGLVLGAVAYAFRPRRADAPVSVQPEGFADSTEFARSTVMPPQEPPRAHRGGPATGWSAQVFDDIAWQRIEALRAELSSTSTDAPAPARDTPLGPADRERLLAAIAQRPPEQQRTLLARAYQGEYWRPTCPGCGQQMVHRSARGEPDFWGCSDFPRCRSTLPMRT